MKLKQLITLCLLGLCFSCSEPAPVSYSKELTCYFFVSPDCPACRSYAFRIRQLVEQYEKNVVKFKVVYAEQQPDAGAVDSVRRFFNFNVPLLVDSSLKLATNLGATVTPQAILQSGTQVIYAGAIDDYYYSIGRHRNKPTQHFLQQAIQHALDGKAIEPARTKAYGCRIKF